MVAMVAARDARMFRAAGRARNRIAARRRSSFVTGANRQNDGPIGRVLAAQLALLALVLALLSMHHFIASTGFTLSWSRCDQNTVCMAYLMSSYSSLHFWARFGGILFISTEHKRVW